jgi:hypothetical protein
MTFVMEEVQILKHPLFLFFKCFFCVKRYMGPRLLQSQIHSDYSTASGVWASYRTGIESMYEEISSRVDFNDHLIREYNRKIDRLNQPTGLFISPYDAGFRFIDSPPSII